MALKPSSLVRIKLTIQENTPTRNSYNEDVDSWNTYCTRRAEQAQLFGSEYIAYQQHLATQVFKFKLRYDSKTKSITPSMRAIMSGRTLEIKAATPTPDKREVHLICKEVVS